MNFLKKIIHLPTPVELGQSERNALPYDEEDEYSWADYHKEVKESYPVKYFLAHTIPHLWRVKVSMNIDHFFYWLKSVTYKKYHLLDLRQPKNDDHIDNYRWGWLDECDQLIYANFNILVNYYEGVKNCKYSYDATDEGIAKLEKEFNDPEDIGIESQIHMLKEVKDLRQYWVIDRKNSTREIDRLRTDWYKNRNEDKKTGNERWNKLNKAEEDFYNEEEEMLIRLIKIRRGLWV